MQKSFLGTFIEWIPVSWFPKSIRDWQLADVRTEKVRICRIRNLPTSPPALVAKYLFFRRARMFQSLEPDTSDGSDQIY
jgi:hypothetical protein